MKNAQQIAIELIERKIYLLHGQKIMLDRDLAELYGVDTRTLNQAVRRNIDRFPDDFMISLSRDEIRNISQFVICSKIKHAKNVYAFTEQGVAMLSGVLNSQRAILVNIAIMRAFVRMREAMNTSRELVKKLQELESRVVKHDESIGVLFKAIRSLMVEPEKPKKQIGFTAKETRAAYSAKKARAR